MPPRHPLRAGWYAAGTAPGDLGPAVLAGHVDSRRGPAVFWRLSSLQCGDRMAVTRADGRTVRFRVTSVRHVDRARFPTRAVYGPVPDRALRLITCGGTYDHAHGRYRQNVVVFALAVRPAAAENAQVGDHRPGAGGDDGSAGRGRPGGL